MLSGCVIWAWATVGFGGNIFQVKLGSGLGYHAPIHISKWNPMTFQNEFGTRLFSASAKALVPWFLGFLDDEQWLFTFVKTRGLT